VRWGVVEDSADGYEHALKIVEHVVVPETNDTVAVSSEFRCAAIIRVLIARMLTAIDLDCELRFRAGEVDDAPADGVLAAKFPCGEALA